MVIQSLDDLKQEIVKRCEEHWEATHKTYLLSKLGADVRGLTHFIRENTGKAPLEFVKAELADAVRPEQWPSHPNIWGLFPRGVVLTEPIDQYFPQKFLTDNREQASSGGRRYNSRFWAAFAKPLSDDMRRFLDPTGRVTFHDIPSETFSMPSGMYEIERALIPSPTHPQRDKVVAGMIMSWLSKVGLQEDDFLDYSTNRAGMGKSELENLLFSLSDADLKRLSMPLDIIYKLHNTRRR